MISTAYIDYPYRKTVVLSSTLDIVFFTVADGFPISAIQKGKHPLLLIYTVGFPGGSVGKESVCNAGDRLAGYMGSQELDMKD